MAIAQRIAAPYFRRKAEREKGLDEKIRDLASIAFPYTRMTISFDDELLAEGLGINLSDQRVRRKFLEMKQQYANEQAEIRRNAKRQAWLRLRKEELRETFEPDVTESVTTFEEHGPVEDDTKLADLLEEADKAPLPTGLVNPHWGLFTTYTTSAMWTPRAYIDARTGRSL